MQRAAGRYGSRRGNEAVAPSLDPSSRGDWALIFPRGIALIYGPEPRKRKVG